MATLVRRSATYEDLLRRSRQPVAEIVDGGLYASGRPPVACALAASGLNAAVGAGCTRRRGVPRGFWLLFDPELQLGDDILVPDLAGWGVDRLPVGQETVAVDVVPDWVCEVLSPASEAFDREQKLPAYARHGVAHAWVADPARRSLEVLRREATRWVCIRRFEGAEVVSAEPFAWVDVDLLTLWGDMPPSLAAR
jgi:hypothetical protein